MLYLSDEESFQMQYTGMVSAREDGFKTDVSLHIQPFFKQNHLDYYLWEIFEGNLLLSEVRKIVWTKRISREI